ncbi:MAG TPA: sugar transferase [Flavisolibacter sp.]|jgi:putative colanic acid biosynthesis UDP-glucose lipid carrier transferase|nr:sugar transferase [Flavisolibacter sp.]
MENSTAHETHETLETYLFKKPDYYGTLDVVPKHELYIIPIDHNIPLEQKVNLFLKRSFDLFMSLLAIVGLLSWLFPLIALLIRVDSRGPIFFLQRRNKKNGKLFTCIKFRTMIVNVDADILPAAKYDYRITKLGAFLRKHHLDELPQLVNVLLGDMSLIGPRPYMSSDNEKYEPLIKNYSVRYKVKPGITGLAQVFDYVNPVLTIESMRRRVGKDVYYVYNWSPALDAKIILYTFLKMIRIK